MDLTSIQSVGMGAVMAPPNSGVGCEFVEIMVWGSELRLDAGKGARYAKCCSACLRGGCGVAFGTF